MSANDIRELNTLMNKIVDQMMDILRVPRTYERDKALAELAKQYSDAAATRDVVLKKYLIG